MHALSTRIKNHSKVMKVCNKYRITTDEQRTKISIVLTSWLVIEQKSIKHAR